MEGGSKVQFFTLFTLFHIPRSPMYCMFLELYQLFSWYKEAKGEYWLILEWVASGAGHLCQVPPSPIFVMPPAFPALPSLLTYLSQWVLLFPWSSAGT